jgi:hypothetical protein
MRVLVRSGNQAIIEMKRGAYPGLIDGYWKEHDGHTTCIRKDEVNLRFSTTETLPALAREAHKRQNGSQGEVDAGRNLRPQQFTCQAHSTSIRIRIRISSHPQTPLRHRKERKKGEKSRAKSISIIRTHKHNDSQEAACPHPSFTPTITPPPFQGRA